MTLASWPLSCLIFVETQEAQEHYPMPAAFAAYASYMDLRLGQEKYQDKK